MVRTEPISAKIWMNLQKNSSLIYVFSDDEDSDNDLMESSDIEVKLVTFLHPDMDYQLLIEAKMPPDAELRFNDFLIQYDLWMWSERDVEESCG